jgi:hypothetical protein
VVPSRATRYKEIRDGRLLGAAPVQLHAAIVPHLGAPCDGFGAPAGAWR